MGDSGYEKHSRAVHIERDIFTISRKERGSYVHARHQNAAQPKVVLAPGLGETAERSFFKPTVALAERGHDVFTLTHPDTAPDDEALEATKKGLETDWLAKFGSKVPEKEAKKLFKKIPLTELRKALALIQFIETMVQKNGNISPVDIIGHSQGGANALIAAFLRPDLFRKLILVNPAGQSHERFLRMFGSFHWSAIREAWKTWNRKHLEDAVRSFISHLGMGYIRAIQQGIKLAKFNAYDYLKVLASIAPEVERVTLYDSDDRLFRKDKIEQAARIARNGSSEKDTLGGRKPTRNMGHYGPVTHPEEYADIFHGILAGV